jgi:hypothetical protein
VYWEESKGRPFLWHGTLVGHVLCALCLTIAKQENVAASFLKGIHFLPPQKYDVRGIYSALFFTALLIFIHFYQVNT